MKKQYFCNPLNMDYRYQFIQDMRSGEDKISREAADPSMILFQGKYYIFASMTLSVWVSEDMVHWESHRLPESLPLYDYAPDVRVIGDYVYFSASRRGTICDFYRTKDILNGPFERIPGTFDFWDPNLFLDDDGKLYFYWGCNNVTPIWGVELEPETMVPKTERKELIYGQPEKIGYERVGENHSKMPLSEEEAVEKFKEFLKAQGKDADHLTEEQIGFAKIMFSQRPFIEGAWMTKHDGTYYLQYAGPGTEYNVYGDGVYESDSPLGPFRLAKNNPYSYKPGGFLRGAGHGSTMEDRYGNWWHTATMQISKNHDMERRVGIWRAGFDKDGVLFCNQQFGDWPMAVEQAKEVSCPKTASGSHRTGSRFPSSTQENPNAKPVIGSTRALSSRLARTLYRGTPVSPPTVSIQALAVWVMHFKCQSPIPWGTIAGSPSSTSKSNTPLPVFSIVSVLASAPTHAFGKIKYWTWARTGASVSRH